MERLAERLAIAGRALGTLQELADKQKVTKVERDAAIQRFEYSVEAVWKAVQLYLREREGLDPGSPKGVVRASHQIGALSEDDAKLALEMIDDRNRTVHTDNEALAEAIYGRIHHYARLMEKWLEAVARRSDAPERQR